jgi:hypothetical protein
MMMSKKAAMAPMMAWRTLAMPLTIAMRQLPIVRKSAVICGLLAFTLLPPGKARIGLGTYTGYDGTHCECVCLYGLGVFVLW